MLCRQTDMTELQYILQLFKKNLMKVNDKLGGHRI